MKKGFTLIELLAVIAILAILSLLTIPNIIETRKEVLENSYQSKVSTITNGAKDWANDNLVQIPSPVTASYAGIKVCNSDCACILISELISRGYVAGDKNEDDNGHDVGKAIITDPRTGESMNNLLVCVRYDTNDAKTRKIISYIVEE